MNEGDIPLAPIQQSDGRVKNRPVVALRKFPPFGDILVCGVSTQLNQQVPGFDDSISTSDPDYSQSGLVSDSIIRLGFLAVIPVKTVLGGIGSISPVRHEKLLKRLSKFLTENIP
ncbi:MAG: transcriptional regulator [Planctomycetes bacterium]|nr:transcriptional regulator [Planctomycetota bacterium]